MSGIRFVTSWNWREKTIRHPPQPPVHPLTPPNTPGHFKTPQAPQNHSSVSTRTLLTSAKHLSDVLSCQGVSEGCQERLRVSTAGFGMLRICQRCYGSVLGKLEGVGGLRGCHFPSISFNFRKSQMGSGTFSIKPGGPRCLKYQNVPNLPTSWPIGKPLERFQSWVIRVYFISVPMDHTVTTRKYLLSIWPGDKEKW